MKEYLKYIGINLVDYSDDELKDIYNEISVEYGKAMEMEPIYFLSIPEIIRSRVVFPTPLSPLII